MRIIFLLILACYCRPTHALGNKGHWLVCQLAYQQLPLPYQARLDQLLTGLNQLDNNNINHYLKRDSEHKINFADACSWPDAIKTQGNKQYNHWHYINVSRRQTEIDSSTCTNECVTSAIHFHANTFKNSTLKNERAKALLFFSHWVGDIHQPLHVSYQSDLGGNETTVINAINACQNLHRIWDSCLLKKQNKKQAFTQLNTIKFNFSNNDIVSVENVNIWATESLHITRQASVQYCILDIDSQYCRSNSQPITLSSDYFRQHTPLLMTRIHRAAQRLNYFLLKNL